jgi:hypothetical protein
MPWDRTPFIRAIPAANSGARSPLSAASTASFRTAVIRTLIETDPRPRPQEYVESVTRSPEELTTIDLALCGFRQIIKYLFRLDSLLTECENVPVFQSALWHYYSYWFDAASRSVKNGLRAMIRPFALWHPPPNTEGTENDSAAEEISSFVNKATEVIDRLCSTRYAHPLRRAFGISEPTWTPSKSPLFAEFLRGRGIIPTEVPGPDPGFQNAG